MPPLDITVNHGACYVFFLQSNNAILCHKFMCNKTYKSRSNGPIMILTNHFEPLTAMYNQHSIAIKTVLLSECQNAGLASINDSQVANNQATLAHARTMTQTMMKQSWQCTTQTKTLAHK